MPRKVTIGQEPQQPPNKRSETLKGIGANNEETIDIARFETALRNLRQHSQSIIKDIKDAQLLDDFRKVMEVVNISEGTEAYAVVHELVRKHFNDVVGQGCEFGSIQAFFNGCVIKTNLSGNPSCSPLCAGGLPPHPDLAGWSDCEYLVINYSPEAHSFTVLNEPSSKSRAAIYMPERYEFKGFNRDELTRLSDYGIKEVKLIKYASSTKYAEESSNFIPLAATSQSEDGSGSSSSSSLWGWGVLIIIIIVVLALIALFAGAGMSIQV